MRCFETQIAETNAKLSEFESKNALHTRRIEGQDDRIAELESQKPLDLEQKAPSEQIKSEHASCKQFESRLASERKTCQELIETEVKSLPTWLHGLTAMFNARNENLTSIPDAGFYDREEKQQEQNQAEMLLCVMPCEG